MDEDDEFLYGFVPPPSTETLLHKPPQSAIVAQLEQVAEQEDEQQFQNEPVNEAQGDAETIHDSDDSEDDVEFIMEAPSRTLDFRSGAPPPKRAHSHLSLQAKPPPQAATSEYNTIPRIDIPQPPAPVPSVPANLNNIPQAESSIPGVFGSFTGQESTLPDDQTQPQATQEPQDYEPSVDTNALPPVTAPPSHPSIDPTIDGSIEGRSILEVDLSAMTDKPWRKPGSDISDWFNYGFDEISWEAYCFRRRDVGDLANVLKTSVLNFTGLPEEQITQLPPEVRNMVMTGTSAMFHQNPAPFAHPGMMDMSMMGNPMDMGMGMMIPPHDTGPGPGMAPQNMLEQQNGATMQQDPNEYMEPLPHQQSLPPPVHIPTPQQTQPSYSVTPVQTPRDTSEHSPTPVNQTQPSRGSASGTSTSNPPSATSPYGGPPSAPQGPRGSRGGYIRGRGRGYIDTRPPPPLRPISPLPANVPTGPRNQNKYKDKDRDSGISGDGLDYGAGKERESEEKDRDRGDRERDRDTHGRGRKRRASPSYDDRGSKRR